MLLRIPKVIFAALLIFYSGTGISQGYHIRQDRDNSVLYLTDNGGGLVRDSLTYISSYSGFSYTLHDNMLYVISEMVWAENKTLFLNFYKIDADQLKVKASLQIIEKDKSIADKIEFTVKDHSFFITYGTGNDNVVREYALNLALAKSFETKYALFKKELRGHTGK